MPTQPYRTKDGKRVPGVTTILGRFKQSDGLIWWASRLALDPLLQVKAIHDNGSPEALAAFFLRSSADSWDYQKVRDKAADAGTVAHAMFDAKITGRSFDVGIQPAHIVEMAMPAYRAALEWAEQSQLQIVETEQALVSERHRFGGTRDAILVSGKRAVGDWKTSKAIYPEYLAQIAAYGILDEEAGNTIDGGYHLLRFSKQEKPEDPVHFTHHHWSHMDAGKRYFLLLREAYDLAADLGRLCK